MWDKEKVYHLFCTFYFCCCYYNCLAGGYLLRSFICIQFGEHKHVAFVVTSIWHSFLVKCNVFFLLLLHTFQALDVNVAALFQSCLFCIKITICYDPFVFNLGSLLVNIIEVKKKSFSLPVGYGIFVSITANFTEFRY